MSRKRFVAPLQGAVQEGDSLVTPWMDLSGGKWDVGGDIRIDRVSDSSSYADIGKDVKTSVEAEVFITSIVIVSGLLL